MLRCLAAIFSAVVSLATLGCFHHVGQVVVEPGSTESALSQPEVQAAVAAIAPAVAKLGFVIDPRPPTGPNLPPIQPLLDIMSLIGPKKGL